MNSNENTTTRLSILKSLNNKLEEDTQQSQSQSNSNNHHHHHHHHHNHHNRNHSILTRNLRLNNGQQQQHQLLNSPQKISIINNLSSSTATNQQQQQQQLQQNQNLINKTGFTDLSFIDFSCVNFPRIAQNYCELWPRKVSINSPLHNYTCSKCSHSFPCPSSLKLHNEKEINCKLLLNNLNKIVYKTLDDLIKEIEEKEEKEKYNKMNYLKKFGLIRKESLKEREEELKGKKIKLREKLIDINYQFIIDLDKWKLQQHLNQMTYKILLKPNVNLNRPLLIRSKKIKRIKSFSYFKHQQQLNKNNNEDDSTYRIVRIARSNSTSSNSTTTTTTTTTQNENNKRKIINIDNKRIKKQQKTSSSSSLAAAATTTNVDSISFKKILTISNELILNNKNKSNFVNPPSLPPPPSLPTLFKVTDQQQQHINKKVFEMPKLQPISSISSKSTSTTTTTTNNNNNQQKQPPKLKPIKSQQQQQTNENVSLKCKFCPNIFKGQSKFLQHVLNAHPELIRERFNRHQNNGVGIGGVKIKV